MQHSKYICDGRAIFADHVCNVQLSVSEVLDQLVVPFRFFNRVQIGALKILDQGEREHFLIAHVLDDRRNDLPAQIRLQLEVGAHPQLAEILYLLATVEL